MISNLSPEPEAVGTDTLRQSLAIELLLRGGPCAVCSGLSSHRDWSV